MWWKSELCCCIGGNSMWKYVVRQECGRNISQADLQILHVPEVSLWREARITVQRKDMFMTWHFLSRDRGATPWHSGILQRCGRLSPAELSTTVWGLSYPHSLFYGWELKYYNDQLIVIDVHTRKTLQHGTNQVYDNHYQKSSKCRRNEVTSSLQP